jgi:hypothetical protein
MIGEPALVLGFCRYDDDDSFWQKFQYFTMENYLNCKFVYKPPDNNDSFTSCVYKNQEECDKEAKRLREMAQACSKYHQMTVHFDSINKDVKVLQCGHDFNLSQAEPVELTKPEWELLRKEMNQDHWVEFDEETWGK